MPFNQPLLFSVKQHWCCIEYVKQADGLEKKYCLHYSQQPAIFSFDQAFPKEGLACVQIVIGSQLFRAAQ